MVGRDRQRAVGVGQGTARIAGVAPRRGAQHQHLDIVLAQADGAVEVGDGARPGLHGRIGQAAIDPEVRIAGLEFQRLALGGSGLLGRTRLHPRLPRLRPKFGPQAGPVVAHVARDGLELGGRLGVLARLEHGDGDAMTGAEAAALHDPLLGRRQRLQGLHAREPHAVGVALEMIRGRLEAGRSRHGPRRNDGNGLGQGRRCDEETEQRPQ